MSNQLVKVAATISMKAAVAFLDKNKVTVPDSEINVLLRLLKQHVESTIIEALEDAKLALEANMAQVAEQTFAASMTCAGIAAAKEYQEFVG